MRHRVTTKKLGRTKSHREATLRALVTALLEHKRIHTTETKAKALRPYAEKLITRARKAYLREQQGQLSEGSKHDLHTRRDLANHITKKSVIENLFDEILPEIADRPGGYTRIVKTGFRRGDAGSKALIELVDYNREQTESVSVKPKKKRKPTTEEPTSKVEEVVEDTVEAVEEVAEDVAAATEEVLDTVEEAVEKTTETVAEVVEDTVESTQDTETAEENVETSPVDGTKEQETAEASTEETSSEESTEEKSDDNEEEKKEG
jgi:large subunit ribosomal protein L17